MAIEKSLIGKQDKLLTFGETNSITSAGTYPCGYSASATDGVALEMNKGDLAGFAVNFKMEEAAAGLTNATFKVMGSADKSTWVDLAVSPAIAAAKLTADAAFVVPVPRGNGAYKYVKAVVVTTGTATAGKVSACVDTFAGV